METTSTAVEVNSRRRGLSRAFQVPFVCSSFRNAVCRGTAPAADSALFETKSFSISDTLSQSSSAVGNVRKLVTGLAVDDTEMELGLGPRRGVSSTSSSPAILELGRRHSHGDRYHRRASGFAGGRDRASPTCRGHHLRRATIHQDSVRRSSSVRAAAAAAAARVTLKEQIGLLDSVAMIVGIIIGSGIFVSPKGVLIASGSVGMSLIIWIASGVFSMIGALCYAELGMPFTKAGTAIPKSGGDYAYLWAGFGPLPAFLFLWVALLVLCPSANAIIALTFATYVLQAVFPSCEPPHLAVQLLAAAVIGLLTYINCHNVRWATRIQDVFTGTKVAALLIITGAGLWAMFGAPSNHLITREGPRALFKDTNWDPGSISIAFYAGMFSYAGWNFLNFIVEEVKNPFVNLPRAIWISLPVVTAVYVLANMSYFAVLSKEEILESGAVAVTFADRTLGHLAWLMPIFVACSTFGSLNGGILVTSRLFFVGAREGHLPEALALINIHNFTPVPSLVFLCAVTIVMLFVTDLYVLITYMSFVESLFRALSIGALLYLRWKKPDLYRPIKARNSMRFCPEYTVHLVFPIVFFIVCVMLTIMPIYSSPWEVGVGVAIMLTGLPVYFIFIYLPRAGYRDYELKNKLTSQMSIFCSKFFVCSRPDDQASFFYD
ncbi:unnamed protein product [Notodromas monacha]|uniref:Y+L amino acid transporter 2 n=1 Tax=Notodromas monacha TaxID=399045 RepID=A0A7R9GA85_9CRUS|nr:unnamed protein product [Notodromas monacha]CAG0913430.1 unnamed protein product [Notodromas monacha]